MVKVDKSVTEAYDKNISVFTADVRAVELALNEIRISQQTKHIFFTDSKSALQALKDIWTQIQ